MNDVMDRLRSKAPHERLQGIVRYGMTVQRRLGVSVPDMRELADSLRIEETEAQVGGNSENMP